MTSEFTLKGITKTQKAFLIDMYQTNGGVFTMDQACQNWNKRTVFALSLKRVILLNTKTWVYCFNPDHTVAICSKLASWNVSLREYRADFGAWFDAHLANAPALETQIESVTPAPAPLSDVPESLTTCPTCGGVMGDSNCPACMAYRDIPEFDKSIGSALPAPAFRCDQCGHTNCTAERALCDEDESFAVPELPAHWWMGDDMQHGGGGGNGGGESGYKFAVNRCPRCHSRKVYVTGRDASGYKYLCGSCGQTGFVHDEQSQSVTSAPAPDPVRAEFDAARAAWVRAIKDYNATHGMDLINAAEELHKAQQRYEAAALALQNRPTHGGGGGGDYADFSASVDGVIHTFRIPRPVDTPIERFFEPPRKRYEDGYRLGRLMRGSDKLAGMLRSYVRDRYANAGIYAASSRPRWFYDPDYKTYHWLSGEREDQFMTARYGDDIPF